MDITDAGKQKIKERNIKIIKILKKKLKKCQFLFLWQKNKFTVIIFGLIKKNKTKLRYLYKKS